MPLEVEADGRALVPEEVQQMVQQGVGTMQAPMVMEGRGSLQDIAYAMVTKLMSHSISMDEQKKHK